MSNRASSDAHQDRVFVGQNSVIDFLANEITTHGTHGLGGVEEEILVLDQNGKPLRHPVFMQVLSDVITSLPNGKIASGLSVTGSTIPVFKGTTAIGDIQPETNTTLIELAHRPCADAWITHAQSQRMSQTMQHIARQHGLNIIGGGAAPSMSWDNFRNFDAVIPNADFAYSHGHITAGTRTEYCRTVFGTASVHHNMGFNDPERMARYMATTLRLQPTMIALTGNSPLWNLERARTADGRPLLSYRSNTHLDYARVYGMDGVLYLYPDFLLDTNIDFAKLVQGYLRMPLDRTIVDGKKMYCNALTMQDYLDGFLHQGETYYPTTDALTMMFREPIVDVRPSMTGKGPRIETRAHDCVSHPMAVALDAFYRGVLAKLDEAQELMSGISASEIRKQRVQVCSDGLQTPLRHSDNKLQTQQDLALRILSMAEQGLCSRGLGEEQLLAPLWVIAETGINPAQRTLMAWDENQNSATLMQRQAYNQKLFADGTAFAWPECMPCPRIPGTSVIPSCVPLS